MEICFMLLIIVSLLGLFLLFKNRNDGKKIIFLLSFLSSILFLMIFIFSYYCFKGSALNNALNEYELYQNGHYYLYMENSYHEVSFMVYVTMMILQIGSISYFCIANIGSIIILKNIKQDFIFSKYKKILIFTSFISICIAVLIISSLCYKYSTTYDNILASLSGIDAKESCSYVTYFYKQDLYENIRILSYDDNWEINKLIYGWVNPLSPNQFVAFLDLLIAPAIFFANGILFAIISLFIK